MDNHLDKYQEFYIHEEVETTRKVFLKGDFISFHGDEKKSFQI